MIEKLLYVVEERPRLRSLENLFERGPLELGPLDQLVGLLHVSLMMLAVMVLQRLGRDMRFQRVHAVRERRKFKCHDEVPSLFRARIESSDLQARLMINAGPRIGMVN